jgi:hypothetical protein
MTPEQKRAAIRRQQRKKQQRQRAERFDALMQHVDVVSDEEAEQADMVICLPDAGPRYFTDDLTATCAECGVVIRHRPHVPKRPRKVCIHCALRLIAEQDAQQESQA